METTSAVARLAHVSVSAPLAKVAWQVATVAATAFPARGVAVAAIGPHDTVHLEFSASGLGSTLDERQFAPGFGPALEAARHGRAVVVDDASGTSYDDFRRLAARSGVRQVWAWPLRAADGVVGSLSVYGAQTHRMGEGERERLGSFLSAASVLIADAVGYAGAILTAGQLQEAMSSRAVIEQAKGIIMAHRRCTDEEAFELLKRLSSGAQRKVRAVALDIVRDATA